MTNDEFDFWEKAFLATLGDPTPTTVRGLIQSAENCADAALAVWREKRAEVEREHVEKVCAERQAT